MADQRTHPVRPRGEGLTAALPAAPWDNLALVRGARSRTLTFLACALLLGTACNPVVNPSWFRARPTSEPSPGASRTANPVPTATRATGVIRLDPQTGEVVQEIPLELIDESVLAAGGGAVWVSNHEGVVRIDPARSEVAETIEIRNGVASIAYGEDRLWAVGPPLASGYLRSTLWGIDPETNEVKVEVDAPGGIGYVSVAAGEGFVWPVNTAIGTIDKVDPGTGEVVETYDAESWEFYKVIAVGFGLVIVVSRTGLISTIFIDTGEVNTQDLQIELTSVAVGEDGVWLTLAGSGEVVFVDAATAEQQVFDVGGSPNTVGLGGRYAWITHGDGALTRIDRETGSFELIHTEYELKDAVVEEHAVWALYESVETSVEPTTV